MVQRRFPPSWTVEDIGACFVVKDRGGQKLAYVYYAGAGTTFGGKATQQRRDKADCCEFCEAAGAIARLALAD